jgi:hypothetical protein
MSETTETTAESESSLRGSIVALLTPFFAVGASWLASWVAAHVPGVHLDPNQIVALMVTVVTTVLSIGLKWLHGWQKHETRVSAGTAAPVKAKAVPTSPSANLAWPPPRSELAFNPAPATSS